MQLLESLCSAFALVPDRPPQSSLHLAHRPPFTVITPSMTGCILPPSLVWFSLGWNLQTPPPPRSSPTLPHLHPLQKHGGRQRYLRGRRTGEVRKDACEGKKRARGSLWLGLHRARPCARTRPWDRSHRSQPHDSKPHPPCYQLQPSPRFSLVWFSLGWNLQPSPTCMNRHARDTKPCCSATQVRWVPAAPAALPPRVATISTALAMPPRKGISVMPETIFITTL